MLIIIKKRCKMLYTQEEIEFLKKNYPQYGAGYCAQHLNRTPEAIINKTRRLKLTRNGDARYNRKTTPEGYAHCGMCDQILPDSYFYKKTKEGKYGKKNDYCRSCCQKKARHHYGVYKWRMHDKRKKDPIHFIYVRLKGSANKRKIHFDLTEQQLREKFTTHCPIYKEKFLFFSNSDWSPSIDRIDNNLGYTEENILVVSRKANMQKNNCTVEELKILYEFYSSLKK